MEPERSSTSNTSAGNWLVDEVELPQFASAVGP
jgi:hypothetical protein